MTRSQSDSISTILNCDPAAVAIRASKDHDTLNKLKEVVDQFKRYVGMIVQEDNKVLDSMGNEQGTDSLLTVARHLRENSKHVEASINRLENKSATLHRRRQNVTRSRPITSLSMRLDENSGRKGSTTTPRLPPRPRSLFVVEDPTASSTTVRERPLSPVLLVEDRIDSSIGANRVGMEVQSLNELSTATILSAQECLNVSIVSRRDDVEEGKQIATKPSANTTSSATPSQSLKRRYKEEEEEEENNDEQRQPTSSDTLPPNLKRRFKEEEEEEESDEDYDANDEDYEPGYEDTDEDRRWCETVESSDIVDRSLRQRNFPRRAAIIPRSSPESHGRSSGVVVEEKADRN